MVWVGVTEQGLVWYGFRGSLSKGLCGMCVGCAELGLLL